jgi:hypothetical protein
LSVWVGEVLVEMREGMEERWGCNRRRDELQWKEENYVHDAGKDGIKKMQKCKKKKRLLVLR